MCNGRSNRGETIVESLVSMLIIALVFVFLTNAVMTSARINANVANAESSFETAKAKEKGAIHLIVDDNPTDARLYEVDDDDGEARFYYYE